MSPFSLLLLLLSLPLSSAATAKPQCPSKCGNVTVPYPFGIGVGSGCSLDKPYDVVCNSLFDPPRLSVPDTDIEITDIRNDTVRIKNFVTSKCYDVLGNVSRETCHGSWLY